MTTPAGLASRHSRATPYVVVPLKPPTRPLGETTPPIPHADQTYYWWPGQPAVSSPFEVSIGRRGDRDCRPRPRNCRQRRAIDESGGLETAIDEHRRAIEAVDTRSSRPWATVGRIQPEGRIPPVVTGVHVTHQRFDTHACRNRKSCAVIPNSKEAGPGGDRS